MQIPNRKGEKWKDIEGYEGVYMVSTHGRIKSMPRDVEVEIPSQRHVIRYTKLAMIRKQKVNSKVNSFNGQLYYECLLSLRMDKTEKIALVGRLVYHAFVDHLDFEKDRLLITHKDNDGRNNNVRNLIAVTRSAATRKAYSLSRHKSPFAIKSEKEMKDIRHRAGQSRCKAVQRVSKNGKVLQNFSSIKEAESVTGIAGSNITEVCKGRRTHASGMFWRYRENGGS